MKKQNINPINPDHTLQSNCIDNNIQFNNEIENNGVSLFLVHVFPALMKAFQPEWILML